MGHRTELTTAIQSVGERYVDTKAMKSTDDTKSIIFDRRIIKFIPTLVDIKNVQL